MKTPAKKILVVTFILALVAIFIDQTTENLTNQKASVLSDLTEQVTETSSNVTGTVHSAVQSVTNNASTVSSLISATDKVGDAVSNIAQSASSLDTSSINSLTSGSGGGGGSCQTQPPIYTSDFIPGGSIWKSQGLVSGSIVIGDGPDETGSISLALTNVDGNNEHISESGTYNYTKLIEAAREEAVSRLLQDMSNKGGNAVIDLRFEDSLLHGDAIEITVYGTSVSVSFCEPCEPPC